MSGVTRFTSIVFLFLYTMLVFGCVPRTPFTYEGIISEYGEEPCPVSIDLGRSETSDTDVVPNRLSIVSAIQIALEKNPDIDMAIARIRQSEAMIDEARAVFYPVLSAYSGYSQGDAPSAYLFKIIDQRELPAVVDFNRPGWFENYEMGFKAGINIYNGGRDILRKRMAETGLEIYELDRQVIENALVSSVIHAYYSVLASWEYISIAQESVSTVDRQLEIMKVRYAAGGALKSDLLSLEVRLAQAREELVRAENNHNLAFSSLSNLLGCNPDTRFDLVADENPESDIPKDYEEGLVYALENRPELKKVRKQIIRSRLELEQAKREYLPSLNGEVKYYMDDSGLDFDNERENWTAGVMLNWDLFTGRSTSARIKKSESTLKEMLAADRDAVLSIQLDLKNAYLKLEEAISRESVTKASVEQAEESLRLVKKQYEGGSSTITRYLDAELARNSARLRATSSHYDMEKAKADVARALGRWVKYAREVEKDYE